MLSSGQYGTARTGGLPEGASSSASSSHHNEGTTDIRQRSSGTTTLVSTTTCPPETYVPLRSRRPWAASRRTCWSCPRAGVPRCRWGLSHPWPRARRRASRPRVTRAWGLCSSWLVPVCAKRGRVGWSSGQKRSHRGAMTILNSQVFVVGSSFAACCTTQPQHGRPRHSKSLRTHTARHAWLLGLPTIVSWNRASPTPSTA